MSRNRVQNRAEMIYDFLVQNLNQAYTKHEVIALAGLQPGVTTGKAFHRAWEMASKAGYHLREAVPANGFTYMVTNSAENAFDSTMHLRAVESGVRKRADVGTDFLRREYDDAPPALKPSLKLYLSVRDQAEKSMAAIQEANDEFVKAMIVGRREERQAEDES